MAVAIADLAEACPDLYPPTPCNIEAPPAIPAASPAVNNDTGSAMLYSQIAYIQLSKSPPQ